MLLNCYTNRHKYSHFLMEYPPRNSIKINIYINMELYGRYSISVYFMYVTKHYFHAADDEKTDPW